MENVFISKLEIKWEDGEVKGEDEGKKKEEKLITKQKSEMKVFEI